MPETTSIFVVCKLFVVIFMRVALHLLSEEERQEFGEVYTPVFPDVSLGSLEISIGISVVIQFFAVCLVGFVKKIGIAYAYPVKSGLFVELNLEFLVQVVIDRALNAFVRFDGGGEKSYITEHVGILF